MYSFLYFPSWGWKDKGDDGEGCFQELLDSVVVKEASFKSTGLFLGCVESRHSWTCPLVLSDLTILWCWGRIWFSFFNVCIICLFAYLAVPGLSWGMRDLCLPCGVKGLQCSVWAFSRAARTLACRVLALLPPLGPHPGSLHWECGVSAPRPLGSPHVCLFQEVVNCCCC